MGIIMKAVILLSTSITAAVTEILRKNADSQLYAWFTKSPTTFYRSLMGTSAATALPSSLSTRIRASIQPTAFV